MRRNTTEIPEKIEIEVDTLRSITTALALSLLWNIGFVFVIVVYYLVVAHATSVLGPK